MGRGGLGGEETEGAEQQEEPESTWSSAANTFRRRSVKSSYRLGIKPRCCNCLYNYDGNYNCAGTDGDDRDDGSRGCEWYDGSRDCECERLASRYVRRFISAHFGSSVKLSFSESFSDHIHRL